MKFREGAHVRLSSATNLPKKLDFSMCSYVHLFDVDLFNVEEIRFKDDEQRKRLMRGCRNFFGYILWGRKNPQDYSRRDAEWGL